MCKLCTALQTLAGAGIMGGTGLGIPGGFTSALGALSSSPIASAAQGALAGAGSGLTAITSAIQSAPGFLTGAVPSNLTSLVPQGITGINPNNLFTSISGQATQLLTNGPQGLTSLLTQASTSGFSTANFKGLIDQYTNGDLTKNLGFNLKDPLSFVTNGLSKEFALGTEKFGQLTADLKTKMGSMFDITKLTSLDDPRALVQNLIDKGHGQLGEILGGQGINVSDLSNIDQKSLTSALSKVTGTDLNTIIKSVGFKPENPDSIKSLADVLDINKVFSAGGVAAAGGSFAALSKKFNNADFTDRFTDFRDLGNFVGDIKVTNTNFLDQLPNMGGSQVNALFATALEKMPEGSGAFGSPTIKDFLGSASGQPYSEGCTTIGSLQAKIANSTLGQNLRNAILAAQAVDENSDPGGVQAAAQITAAVNAINSSTNAELQADLARGNSQFTNFHSSLLREKVNLNKIGFDPTDVPKGSVDEVLGFSATLGTVHQDDFDQGTESFIRTMATPNFAGQAITASIDEGYNHKRLQDRGIPINTQLDPVEWYKKKKSGQG